MTRFVAASVLLFGLIGLAASAHAQIQFASAVGHAAGESPSGGVLLDFDHDGDLDLVVSSRGTDELVLLPNLGDGSFGPSASIALDNASNPEGLAAGDFDGDGDDDLLVVLFGSDQVQLVLGDGSGSFVPGAKFAVGSEPSMVVAADFDGDGFLDGAVNNRVSGDMSVLLNDGRGSFEAAVDYPVGVETRGVAAGDITGDGRSDLVVSARDSHLVRVFRNTGAGAFVTLKDLSLGSILEPQGVALADFDNDGKLDVVTATSGHENQQHASVFLQDNFGNPWVGPINGATGGVAPTGIVAADFDLDGHVDVATSNADSNDVSALKNGGIGIFFLPVVFPVGQNPEVPLLLAGDLDADGDDDVITFDVDGNEFSVLLNQESVCQTNLGFGGPGHAVLSVCGEALATGGSADLLLTGAAPSTTAFLAASTSTLPSAFKGGTLVPLPIQLLFAFGTGPAGQIFVPAIGGGGGPLDVTIQFIIVDAAQPQGFALSNAVKVHLLP